MIVSVIAMTIAHKCTLNKIKMISYCCSIDNTRTRNTHVISMVVEVSYMSYWSLRDIYTIQPLIKMISQLVLEHD